MDHVIITKEPPYAKHFHNKDERHFPPGHVTDAQSEEDVNKRFGRPATINSGQNQTTEQNNEPS